MTKWEAIAEIVKSFNARGAPKLALASLLLIFGIPSGVIGFAIWQGAPQLESSIEAIAKNLIK